MARGYLKRREVAEEAVQETFLKAHRARNGFQGHCHTRTWLYRILVNECLTRVARQKREMKSLSRYALEVGSRCGASWETGDCLAKDRALKAMEECSPGTRRILVLALGEGLSHRQIAESLGISRVAVTRRISKFLQHNRFPGD